MKCVSGSICVYSTEWPKYRLDVLGSLYLDVFVSSQIGQSFSWVTVRFCFYMWSSHCLYIYFFSTATVVNALCEEHTLQQSFQFTLPTTDFCDRCFKHLTHPVALMQWFVCGRQPRQMAACSVPCTDTGLRIRKNILK